MNRNLNKKKELKIVLMITLNIYSSAFLFQDLENYIRNHPDTRFEKLQEIGKQLIDNDIMTQSIQIDVETLINRWENLNKQVIGRHKLTKFIKIKFY
jgi:hypothetical protein